MAYRVLLTDPLGPEGLARLREQPELQIEARPGLPPAELSEAVRGFDALIIRSGTKVTAEVLAGADRLRVIGRAGIGIDNVDVDAATKKGIVVMNTPGGSNVTTAEHAITLMLALARNVPQAAAAVRAGRWEREKWLGAEVCNKVLGIIGLGNIGAIVAERALGLRMKVIAFDPFVTPEVAARLRVELVSLDELYARADFVTIHTPLTVRRGSSATTAGAHEEGCPHRQLRAAATSKRRRTRTPSAAGSSRARRSTCSRRSRRRRGTRCCSSST
jgi:D-3-phosphoglycerate dehydrogenase